MSRKVAKKVKITPELLKLIEGFGVIRLPHDQIAVLLDISKETFELLLKTNAKVRHALDTGKASASTESRKTLYQMAVKEKNPRMLEFYLRTQEGFKSTDRLELTGAGGGPVRTQYHGMTDDQLKQYLKDLSYDDE